MKIVMTSETEHGDHEAHAKGLAALIGIENWPASPHETVLSCIDEFLKVSHIPLGFPRQIL
jgi:hypothetical protein